MKLYIYYPPPKYNGPSYIYYLLEGKEVWEVEFNRKKRKLTEEEEAVQILSDTQRLHLVQ